MCLCIFGVHTQEKDKRDRSGESLGDGIAPSLKLASALIRQLFPPKDVLLSSRMMAFINECESGSVYGMTCGQDTRSFPGDISPPLMTLYHIPHGMCAQPASLIPPRSNINLCAAALEVEGHCDLRDG